MTLAIPYRSSHLHQTLLRRFAALLRRPLLFPMISTRFSRFCLSETAASHVESVASALLSHFCHTETPATLLESIASTLFPLTREGGGGKRSSGEDPYDYPVSLELLNSATLTPLHPSIPKSDELTHIESNSCIKPLGGRVPCRQDQGRLER